MSIAETLLPEFDHEMGVTRRLLERLPDGQFAWKPHDKSMSLGRLGEHVAELPTWVSIAIEHGEFDLARERPSGYQTPATRDALVAFFDANVVSARAALAGRTDAELLAPWTLKQGETVIFTMPKAAVLRSFVLNHHVHHRGQLSVYLRLCDVPVPSMYGPSADEAM